MSRLICIGKYRYDGKHRFSSLLPDAMSDNAQVVQLQFPSVLCITAKGPHSMVGLYLYGQAERTRTTDISYMCRVSELSCLPTQRLLECQHDGDCIITMLLHRTVCSIHAVKHILTTDFMMAAICSRTRGNSTEWYTSMLVVNAHVYSTRRM